MPVVSNNASVKTCYLQQHVGKDCFSAKRRNDMVSFTNTPAIYVIFTNTSVVTNLYRCVGRDYYLYRYLNDNEFLVSFRNDYYLYPTLGYVRYLYQCNGLHLPMSRSLINVIFTNFMAILFAVTFVSRLDM